MTKSINKSTTNTLSTTTASSINQFDDKKITITIIENITDNEITSEKVVSTNWGEIKNDFITKHDIREEKNGIALIGASFLSNKNDGVELVKDKKESIVTNNNGDKIVKRVASNIDQYHLLILDYDDGMTVDEAREHFSEFEYLGYTSHNHKKDGIEKFRLVFPLTESVTPDDIRNRKDDILNWAKSADKSTLSIGRFFYLPSCPESRREHAYIWYNNGKLLDLLSFSKTQERTNNCEKTQNDCNTLPNGLRETIISGLLRTNRVEDDLWYKIAGALHNNGYSVQDFIKVSAILKSSKTPIECINKWESSKKYKFSIGVIINFLKENNITVYKKREVDNSQDIELNQTKISKLENKIHSVKNNTELTTTERNSKIKKLQKEISSLETEINELIDEEKPTITDLVDEIINSRLIYYVSDSGEIVEYFPESGNWIHYKVTDFINGETIVGKRNARKVLLQQLQQHRRSYSTQQLSAKKLPPYVLNRFRRDHWLSPKKGEYHEVFDILFRSLGDNKPENILHIKQVIAWKYLHPETYNLPCIVIYGEGGAGKNTLVERVLGIVFGKSQVAAVRQEQIRNFNGIIEGKMVVLLDESSADKANMDQMKHMIGQEHLIVDRKYGKNYIADNIAIYFTGGNGALGAVLLGRDQSDRRFSILHVGRSIIDHVMEVKQFDKKQDAINWWNNQKHFLEDPNQVAMWLNSILPLVESLQSPPNELHGQDYEALLAAQAGPLEWIIEHIFTNPNFVYISRKDIYDVYRIKSEDYGTYKMMGQQTFMAKLKDALKKEHPEVTYTSRKIKTVTGKYTTATGYFLKSITGAVNEISYIMNDPDHKGKKMLVPFDILYKELEKIHFNNLTVTNDDLME